MTPHERAIIRKIYPLACKGHHQSIKILANLTTARRNKPKCPICGKAVKRSVNKFCGFQHGHWYHKQRRRKSKNALSWYDQAFYNECILRNLMRG